MALLIADADRGSLFLLLHRRHQRGDDFVVLAVALEELLLLGGEIVPIFWLQVQERAAIALPLVRLDDALDGGGDGVVLALHVDGRVDLEAVVEQALVSVARHQVAAQVLGDVRSGLAEDVLHRVDLDGGIVRRFALRPRDHPLFGHPAQDVRSPRLRLLRMREGRELRRRLRQPRDQRHLGQGQLPHVLAIVVLRRRLHAVGVMAEIDLVHVELEDLLLGEVALQAPGEDQLADVAPLARPTLAHVRRLHSLHRGEDRFRRLLRQRRAALHVPAEDDGLEERAGKPGEADPGVVEEARVLAGDEGLLQLLGDALVGDHHPALVVELADQLLVAAPDGGDDGRPVVARPVDRRQAPGEDHVSDCQSATADDEEHAQRNRQKDPERLSPRPAVGEQPGAHAPEEGRRRRPIRRAVGDVGIGHSFVSVPTPKQGTRRESSG